MQLAAMLLKSSMPEAILPRQWLNLMGSGACKLNALHHNGLSRYTNYVILSLLTKIDSRRLMLTTGLNNYK